MASVATLVGGESGDVGGRGAGCSGFDERAQREGGGEERGAGFGLGCERSGKQTEGGAAGEGLGRGKAGGDTECAGRVVGGQEEGARTGGRGGVVREDGDGLRGAKAGRGAQDSV